MSDERNRPWPTAYPRIPAAPAAVPGRARGRGLRLVAVTLVAALAGGLLSGGLVLGMLDRRGVFDPPPPAPSPAPAPQVVSPNIAATQPAPDRVVAVAEAVRPAVVQVDVAGGAGSGNGSGVVYRSDGYIITNNHVVNGADVVSVKFADGSEQQAELVGSDRESDLAVLRVDRRDLVAIGIADAGSLVVGELAVAVGSPFGLEGSVTAGIISALNRGVQVRAPDGGTVSISDVVQTDAPINPGNSGGPLVDGDARLIGINSAILTNGPDLPNQGNAGVGFAIPAALAVTVAEELIASGTVRYAFLGVGSLPVTPEMAQRIGVSAGAYVESVTPGSPAAAAGLREGDVILRVDEQVVDGPDALLAAIRQAEVGQVVRVTYRRDGTDVAVDVALSEAPQ